MPEIAKLMTGEKLLGQEVDENNQLHNVFIKNEQIVIEPANRVKIQLPIHNTGKKAKIENGVVTILS